MASSQVSSLHSDIAHHPRQVHQDLLAGPSRPERPLPRWVCPAGCFAPRPAGSADRPAGHHLPPAPTIPHSPPGRWRPADPPCGTCPRHGPPVRQGWRDLPPRRPARMLSAYVLIQTEISRSPTSPRRSVISMMYRWPMRDHWPLRRHRQGAGPPVWINWAGWWPPSHPGRGRRYPHPHLHSDPSVAAEAVATTATPSSRCGPGNAHQKQELRRNRGLQRSQRPLSGSSVTRVR